MAPYMQYLSLLLFTLQSVKTMHGWGSVSPLPCLHTFFCVLKMEHDKLQLTDGLCCKVSFRSNSHHILSSHWHTVIAWGKIWGWLKYVTTPPSCTPGNIHTLSNNRLSLEVDLVLCNVSSRTGFSWVQWILERNIQKRLTKIIIRLWLSCLNICRLK